MYPNNLVGAAAAAAAASLGAIITLLEKKKKNTINKQVEDNMDPIQGLCGHMGVEFGTPERFCAVPKLQITKYMTQEVSAGQLAATTSEIPADRY